MRVITSSLLLTTALLGLSAGAAHAEEFVIAKVPFEFTLRGQQFPAGTYQIREAGESGGLLSVQGATNGKMSFTFARRIFGKDPAGSQPVLVFRHYENGYRLSTIWESETEGFVLPATESGSNSSRAENTPEGTGGELTYVLASSLR